MKKITIRINNYVISFTKLNSTNENIKKKKTRGLKLDLGRITTLKKIFITTTVM